MSIVEYTYDCIENYKTDFCVEEQVNRELSRIK